MKVKEMREVGIKAATKELFDILDLADYDIDYYYVMEILNDHFGHLYDLVEDKYE